LPDAAHRIGCALRGLRRKPFVVVLVARNHDIRTGVVEDLPDVLHVRIAAMMRAGAEARMMPIGERAKRAVRRELGAQPGLL
jgi:hypothetical protein